MSDEQDRTERLQNWLNDLLIQVRDLRSAIQREEKRKRYPHPFERGVSNDSEESSAAAPVPPMSDGNNGDGDGEPS